MRYIGPTTVIVASLVFILAFVLGGCNKASAAPIDDLTKAIEDLQKRMEAMEANRGVSPTPNSVPNRNQTSAGNSGNVNVTINGATPATGPALASAGEVANGTISAAPCVGYGGSVGYADTYAGGAGYATPLYGIGFARAYGVGYGLGYGGAGIARIRARIRTVRVVTPVVRVARLRGITGRVGVGRGIRRVNPYQRLRGAARAIGRGIGRAATGITRGRGVARGIGRGRGLAGARARSLGRTAGRAAGRSATRAGARGRGRR